MAPWRRLLEDRDAERVWKVIDDIAQALRPTVESLDPEANPAVTNGTAGVALFYAYLGAETGNEEWTALAHRLMEHSIDFLSERPIHADFYEGFTGIGWAVGHLKGMLFEEGEDDDDVISESLVQVLEQSQFKRGDFDLIGGLAGYGIYAFHALPRPAARRSLELLVERLIAIGEPVDGGFSWFTPPEALPDWLREKEPDGRYNLGVSHGVAAVISVLSMCAAAGVMSGEQRAILDRAVHWLLAQKQNGKSWCFANSVVKGRPAGRDRLAWCYGDPGIAGALFTAARHCGDAGWRPRRWRWRKPRRGGRWKPPRSSTPRSVTGRPAWPISSIGCTRRAAIRCWPRRRARGTGTPWTCSGPRSASPDTSSSRRRAGCR